MKRLTILAVLTALILVGAAFDTSTTGKALSGGGEYCFWETEGAILWVDSVAARDTSTIMYQFFGYDSVQVEMYAAGATGHVNDSIFLLLYTVNWYGDYTLNDTIVKGGDADSADGITTVYSTASRLSPGIAIEVKNVGTNDKHDSVQVIVAGVHTYGGP